MGKAPVFVGDELERKFENGCLLKSEDCETAAVSIHDRLYVIGGGDNDDSSSLGVRIYDKKTENWIDLIVLGTKPKLCKGHYVIPLNDARILILKKGADPDDSVSFLEVDTKYVKDQSKVMGMEVVAWSKGVRGNADKPIVISGPSGVGKGTLISKLMNEFPSMFGFSVSHTTRAPRNMEMDGVRYHFTDRNTMEKEIKDGKFLEYASVHGNLYGTSIEAVEVVADSGKRCILDIDVQGARSVKASPLEATFIFICPPSIKELEKCLCVRGTESEEHVLKRLRNAQAEIEQGKSSGIFDHILYNDNLEECYKDTTKTLGLDETSVPTQRSRMSFSFFFVFGYSPLCAHPSFRKTNPSCLIHLCLDAACIGINLSEDFSASKHDNKIIINTGMPGLEKSSKDLIVLDVSSLEGGAPGRTRGLDVYAVDSPL